MDMWASAPLCLDTLTSNLAVFGFFCFFSVPNLARNHLGSLCLLSNETQRNRKCGARTGRCWAEHMFHAEPHELFWELSSELCSLIFLLIHVNAHEGHENEEKRQSTTILTFNHRHRIIHGFVQKITCPVRSTPTWRKSFPHYRRIWKDVYISVWSLALNTQLKQQNRSKKTSQKN